MQYSVRFVFEGQPMVLMFQNINAATSLLMRIKGTPDFQQNCVPKEMKNQIEQLAAYEAAQPFLQDLTLTPDYRVYTNIRALTAYQPVQKQQIKGLTVKRLSQKAEALRRCFFTCTLLSCANADNEGYFRRYSGVCTGSLYDVAERTSQLLMQQPHSVQMQMARRFADSYEKSGLVAQIDDAQREPRFQGEQNETSIRGQETASFTMQEAVARPLPQVPLILPNQPPIIQKPSAKNAEAVENEVPEPDVLKEQFWVTKQEVTTQTRVIDAAWIIHTVNILRSTELINSVLQQFTPQPVFYKLEFPLLSLTDQRFTQYAAKCKCDAEFCANTVQKLLKSHQFYLFQQKQHYDMRFEMSEIAKLHLMLKVLQQYWQPAEFARIELFDQCVQQSFCADFYASLANMQYMQRPLTTGNKLVRFVQETLPLYSRDYLQESFAAVRVPVVRLLKLLSAILKRENCYLQIIATFQEQREPICEYIGLKPYLISRVQTVVATQACLIAQEHIHFVGAQRFDFDALNRFNLNYEKIKHVRLDEAVLTDMKLEWLLQDGEKTLTG